MDSIIIKCVGILKKEIILSALQEYKLICIEDGNMSRANYVSDIIYNIKFE